MKKSTHLFFVATIVVVIGTIFLLSSFFNYKKNEKPTNSKENSEFVTKNTTQQADAFLKEHNRIRGERGLPPLKWSKTLEDYARSWAKQLSKSCNLQHRQNNKYGENLAMAGGMGKNPETFVKMWEREKAAFDEYFGNGGKCCGGDFGSYGHYSQLVWRKTTEVGCAMVQCADGTYLVVCNYNPPGNMQGTKPY